MSHTICLLPGDGIGPEVTAATRHVIEAAGVDVEWVELPAGAGAIEEFGTPLPERTLEEIAGHRVAIKGPITTPIGSGFRSVNVQLRQQLNLFAAVRPVRTMPGIKTRFDNVEIVVIRENTEGMYSGIENEIVPDVITSLKVTTAAACSRIVRYAFDYAKKRNRRKITVFHKANIMKLSDGLFLDCARRVHEEVYPDCDYEELIIDNGCMQLVRDPSQFDVLVLENFYGDIVSDLCAGLVGGLGMVPGANIGSECAVFEAVHGSAPDIAGKNIANPLACIMSGVMMLNHIGQEEAADRIKAAYNAVLAHGNPEELTPDIGGAGATTDFTNAIIARIS